MTFDQLLVPFVSALALSLLGMPRLPLLHRGGVEPTPSLRSRWALFAWFHPFWAAVLRWAVILTIAVALASVAWRWLNSSGIWAMVLDRMSVAFEHVWNAGR